MTSDTSPVSAVRAGSVIVTGAFDDLRSSDLRFLQEAAEHGPVTGFVWDDAGVVARVGKAPKFPLAEREYVLNAVRYVSRVVPVRTPAEIFEKPQGLNRDPLIAVLREHPEDNDFAHLCRDHRVRNLTLPLSRLQGFPAVSSLGRELSTRKKVVVTGCYDWLHSGHVRFFEEVSGLGDLYVVVGHDTNIRLLKGEGHPLLPQEERRYLTGSIRYVTESLISTGEGWLDADPEIRRLKPDIYAVNEDGDRGGKREYCQQMGIEYVVLKRAPAPGLQKRSSTELRGF